MSGTFRAIEHIRIFIALGDHANVWQKYMSYPSNSNREEQQVQYELVFWPLLLLIFHAFFFGSMQFGARKKLKGNDCLNCSHTLRNKKVKKCKDTCLQSVMYPFFNSEMIFLEL